MDLSEEWKFHFRISSVFTPPLLLADTSATGPLFFNPSPNTLIQFSSFLISGNHCPDAYSSFDNNCLQLFQCSNNTILIFYPSGQNLDEVGFAEFFEKKSPMAVRVNDKAHHKLNHPIMKILVNQLVEGNAYTHVGYLLACTKCSVHWFSIKTSGEPSLIYLGCKDFTHAVVNACWSPHLVDESVVLLDNGELFLFNLKTRSLSEGFEESRMQVSSEDSESVGKNKWLGCEFSWHPRILIVARNDAVFLVDFRCNRFDVKCLVKIEKKMDQFVAFSKVGSDCFYFVVGSKCHLFLCDVRRPLQPVLQWDHTLDNPSYIDVYRLSELRFQARDDRYKLASDLGFCIIMGSFWNCEFCLFCYGPPLPDPSGYVSSKVCESFYAWGLPSELSLLGHQCWGSCLVKEEYFKDALPEWIAWQQKKERVLGFSILGNNLSAHFSEPDEFGGFTLIRFLSSGKLELQHYCASWDFDRVCEKFDKAPFFQVENILLNSKGRLEYKFPKKYKYLDINYLYRYINGNLSNILVSSIKKLCKGTREIETCDAEFHKILCEKLEAFGVVKSGPTPAVSVVLKDARLPTSMHEVALRRLWAGLPTHILLLAFSSYSDLLKVDKMSLEFLDVPDQLQLPPFFLRRPSGRSNKWSGKVQRGNDVVGPVLPIPVLLTLGVVDKNGIVEEAVGYSYEAEVELHCDEVMRVANEETRVGSFFLYNQVPYSRKCSNGIPREDYCKDDKFATLICKRQENDTSGKMETAGPEMFDDLSPGKLNFGGEGMRFGIEELKFYKMFKRQFSNWQKSFGPCQRFCTSFEN